MIRSALVAAALASTGLVALAPMANAAARAGQEVKLTGTVVSSSPSTQIALTKGGAPAGSITFSDCNEGSTSFTCKGKATVKGFGKHDAIKVVWHCPPKKGCAKVAAGSLTGKHGKEASVQLEAQVSKAVSTGHSWTIVFTPV